MGTFGTSIPVLFALFLSGIGLTAFHIDKGVDVMMGAFSALLLALKYDKPSTIPPDAGGSREPQPKP